MLYLLLFCRRPCPPPRSSPQVETAKCNTLQYGIVAVRKLLRLVTQHRTYASTQPQIVPLPYTTTRIMNELQQRWLKASAYPGT